MESAPADCSREDLIRIRRTALIEFEINRSPDAPNRRIAQTCRTSTGAVAAIRGSAKRADEGLRAPLSG